MTITWEIESQIIPRFFNENKGYTFENFFSLSNEFVCNIFNNAFELFADKLKTPIQYSPDEFNSHARQINETDRIIYIELPKPRKSDFSYNVYAKYYFIPYRLKANGVEIFDMFGIDAIKDTNNGLIIWYKDSQHLISNIALPVNINDKEKIIEFMSKYIFERIDKTSA